MALPFQGNVFTPRSFLSASCALGPVLTTEERAGDQANGAPLLLLNNR